MKRHESTSGLLALIGRLATVRGREQAGAYAIEGLRLHERALRAGMAVEQTVIGESLRHDTSDRVRALLAQLEATACRLHVVPDDVMAELTEGRSQGAIVSPVATPPPADLAVLIQDRARDPVRLLVAVDVVDPGNTGALVRTAHASGTAAFVGVGQTDPYHPRATRTSMGSLFRLPVLRYARAAPLLADLERLGVTTAGTGTQGTPLPHADIGSGPIAVFVGSEYWGLPVALSRALQHQWSIPMEPGIDSYSVNAAAAIVLYELRRRTWIAPGSENACQQP